MKDGHYRVIKYHRMYKLLYTPAGPGTTRYERTASGRHRYWRTRVAAQREADARNAALHEGGE